MQTLKAELFYGIAKFLEEESCTDAAELVRKFIDENSILPKRVNTLGQFFNHDFKSFDNVYREKDPRLLYKYYEILVDLLKKKEWNVNGSNSIFGITARLDRSERKITPSADSLHGLFFRRQKKWRDDACNGLYSRLNVVRHNQAHRNAIYCVLFDHRGEYMFTGSDDYTIKIWSLHSTTSTKACDIRHVLRGHVAEIIELAISPDNHLLASVDSSTCLIIWCIRTGQPILSVRGSPINRVLSGLCFLPLHAPVTVSKGCDTRPSETEAPQSSVSAQCDATLMSTSTGWLAVTSFGGFLHLIPYKHHIRPSNDAEGSTNRWSCCSITVLPTVRFTTAPEGTPTEFWPSITCMDVSPGCALIATGCSDQRVRLYHLVNPMKPELAAVLDAHEECVNSVAFSHCGLKLATGSSDGGSCWLWRFQAGQWRSLALTCRRRIKCRPCLLTWSKHDRYLIASMKNGSVYVYYGDSGRLMTVIEGHEGAIHAVTPSPLDENIVATAGVDGRFQVWHIERHRDYMAQQEATVSSGSSNGTTGITTADVSTPSNASALLYYYRYPPGRFHLASGFVWLPPESTSPDQPVWSGARRAPRDTSSGTSQMHETINDGYVHHGIGSNSQLYQRITVCRALPVAEGIGFVLATKNGLISFFRPGFQETASVEDPSDGYGYEPNSWFHLTADQNKVEEQFFHWELDTAVWRQIPVDESDPEAMCAFRQTALILGSPQASQAAGACFRIRGQRNSRFGGSTGRQARAPSRPDSSNDGSISSVTTDPITLADGPNLYKPPPTILFEIVHEPSGVPFHRLPPPYLTNFTGAPLSVEAQLRVPGRSRLERLIDLTPTLTIDEDDVEIVLDDIQFCSDVPPDYCPSIRASSARPIVNKAYLWQSWWLDFRRCLIEPFSETELLLHREHANSLYRAEVEFYLSKGDAITCFGESPANTEKPYLSIQPTQNAFGVTESYNSTLYQSLLSSMNEDTSDRTGPVIPGAQLTNALEPPVEIPGPSFLHTFLAKKFESRNGTNQSEMVSGGSSGRNGNTSDTRLIDGNGRVQPLQSSDTAQSHVLPPTTTNDTRSVRTVDELDDVEEEDLDEASEESEWSEHIDVDIGWWHRQRRRTRPRRAAAHETEELSRVTEDQSDPGHSDPRSTEGMVSQSRAGRPRTRRVRHSSTSRYQQQSHQQRRRQRRSGVSIRPCRRSIRQQHRLMLRRRILRDIRLADARIERDSQQQLRRSERRLRGRMRRSSRSSLPTDETITACRTETTDTDPPGTNEKPLDDTEPDPIPARRERLKRRLIRSMDYALFTASSVPLNSIPPEGYLGPDCEGCVYPSVVQSGAIYWPGPHFDWLSTLHPTATPYVPQVGDRLVYIVRGHRDYLSQSWQNNELPQLMQSTDHLNDLSNEVSHQAGSLPWVCWPEIPPYTCGVVTEIHYTTVRTITDDSTTRMPTTTYRGARAGAAWRRQGSRSGVKHVGTSSKRLPTGSEPTSLPGTSSPTVPPVAYSGDSFVRLVTLRLRVDLEDQPYAHLAVTVSPTGSRVNGKSDALGSGIVFIDITYHDVDGVLDFLILRHLFDAALRRQWKQGDIFICPVGDVWWTGCVLHSPANFLTDPQSVCEPSTSTAPVPPHGVKDPWLSCLIRWIEDGDCIADKTVQGSKLSNTIALDPSVFDYEAEVSLPDNVDRLSPWDMHQPYSNSSLDAQENSSGYPSLAQVRHNYGVALSSNLAEDLSTCPKTESDKKLLLSTWSTHAQSLLECFQEIMKLPVSELFNQPVDLVSYPDYLFVNPYPVDLTLIGARLSNGFYRQPEAVRSDLQHLLNNAIRYNRPDSAVVQHAHFVFQLAVQALEDQQFRPCQVPAAYERLQTGESELTQPHPGLSTRRSQSRSESPPTETEVSHPTSMNNHVVFVNKTEAANTPPPCESQVYRTPARRLRHSPRKLPSRSRTDSSSETKTSSLPDWDDEDVPAGIDVSNPCTCSLLPNQWVPRCLSLLKQLYAHDRSMFFRDPIDTTLYPDYMEVISIPMDLSTVKKRLRHTLDATHPRHRHRRHRTCYRLRRRRPVYACPHAFFRDIYLIVRNSKQYNNDPETVIYDDTRWLERWIDRMMVTPLRRCGLLPQRTESNEPDAQSSRWGKPRGRPPRFPARSGLSDRSRVRRPMYKRPRVVPVSSPTESVTDSQASLKPSSKPGLLLRTSSGRVVRPPLRNTGTIEYTSSLSSDDSPSEMPTDVSVKRSRRTRRQSTSPHPSGTPGTELRRSKRPRRRTARRWSAFLMDTNDQEGESDEIE